MYHAMTTGSAVWADTWENTSQDGDDAYAFVAVTLAKEAACDACDTRLRRGIAARVVLGKSGGVRAVRCTECFQSGREPAEGKRPSLTAVTRRSERTLMGTEVRPSAWAAHAIVAAGGIVYASRTVRRVVRTTLVAAKGIARWVFRKLRGDRDPAPAVIREAFEELGPTYVKLGQLVASSHGLFPERYCVEFQKCLDRVPPFPFEDVMRILREELGKNPAEVFSEIVRTPLAAASIAQVHAARLVDGREVVIKVQRPNIDRVVASDLKVLEVGARLFNMLPHGELANPRGIVEDFAQNLAEELDFVREAANMDEFNRIMEKHGHVDVAAPRVIHAYTTKRVLVMERFFGDRVDDVAKLAERGVNGEEKLLLGLRAWFRCMIFHGFFHGDVHAGNLMALHDGRIGFLDFGIVGRFPAERRSQIADYLVAFSTGDFDRLSEVLVKMGSVDATKVDLVALSADLKSAYEPLLGSEGGVKYADMIPAIMRTSVKHGMRLPRDFVLITKQMLYFDRYAKILAPTLNIFRDPRVIGALTEDVMMAQLAALAALAPRRPQTPCRAGPDACYSRRRRGATPSLPLPFVTPADESLLRSPRSQLDFLLRLGFFASAPFGVVFLAAHFPVRGAVVGVMVGLLAVLLGETLETLAKKSWLVRLTLSRELAIQAYYRVQPPRPFLYYVFYPFLFPYWLLVKDARREFWFFKGYTLMTSLVLVGTTIAQYFSEWAPELSVREYMPVVAATLLIESVLVLSLLMPMATTVISLHMAEKRKRLFVLVVAALTSTVIAGAFLAFRRDPLVSFATRWRVSLRTDAQPTKAYAAQLTALRTAWRAVVQAPQSVEDDGKVVGAPLERARAELARYYKRDESFAFDLWATPQKNPRLLVIYSFPRVDRPPVWLGMRLGGAEVRTDKELPEGAFQAMIRAALD
jgi:aarF domain-containing kinase